MKHDICQKQKLDSSSLSRRLPWKVLISNNWKRSILTFKDPTQWGLLSFCKKAATLHNVEAIPLKEISSLRNRSTKNTWEAEKLRGNPLLTRHYLYVRQQIFASVINKKWTKYLPGRAVKSTTSDGYALTQNGDIKKYEFSLQSDLLCSKHSALRRGLMLCSLAGSTLRVFDLGKIGYLWFF